MYKYKTRTPVDLGNHITELDAFVIYNHITALASFVTLGLPHHAYYVCIWCIGKRFLSLLHDPSMHKAKYCGNSEIY